MKKSILLLIPILAMFVGVLHADDTLKAAKPAIKAKVLPPKAPVQIRTEQEVYDPLNHVTALGGATFIHDADVHFDDGRFGKFHFSPGTTEGIRFERDVYRTDKFDIAVAPEFTMTQCSLSLGDVQGSEERIPGKWCFPGTTTVQDGLFMTGDLDRYDLSVNALFRYKFNQVWQAFAGPGVLASYADLHDVQSNELGVTGGDSDWTFGALATAGVRCNLSRRWAVSLESRYSYVPGMHFNLGSDSFDTTMHAVSALAGVTCNF